MARPRDFDLESALDAAVHLFWAQGYGATSVRQLCEAMGIGAGSFYAAFASKEHCFRLALKRYLSTQPVLREAGPDAIRTWFEAILDPARTPKGCLLVLSAVEHPLLDQASGELVVVALQALQDFFRRSLRDRGRRARADAALLGAAVLAIHVLARSGASPKDLREIADRALSAANLPPTRARRLARS